MAAEITVCVPDIWVSTIKKIADNRHDLHQNHSSSRPLSLDYELVGMAGEYAFGEVTALPVDWRILPEGDGGVDFTVGKAAIDVKTARKPSNLIVEQGLKNLSANIFVLAGWNDLSNTVKLIGWETKRAILSAPVKDFGYGIHNHFIPASELKDIRLLVQKIDQWRNHG